MDVEHKDIDGRQFLVVDGEVRPSIQFVISKPKDPVTGEQRLQFEDMANNMRYAHSLNLPQLEIGEFKGDARAILVAGGPSVEGQLEKIRELALVPGNVVFAVNWTHTWLINNGIIPHGLVLFEVDAEPLSLMETLHKDVTYYICSHCNRGTFDALDGYKRILWHINPQDELTTKVREELFSDRPHLGGGSCTFVLTVSLALCLGYRYFDVFGADSSYPDENTHLSGYPAAVTDKEDRLDVFARNPLTGEVRKFKSVGYLAHQVDEFAKYCVHNHPFFKMRMYGDGLLQWQHRIMYPGEYLDEGE